MSSLQVYAAVLKMFYGFFHPLEDRIRQYISPALLPDIEKRRTASLIKKDLAVLGFSNDVNLCTSLPQIENAAQAFGALYVLEGSTLGGQTIVKMFSKSETLDIPADALHFFSGYKEETGKMWTVFVEELNKQQEAETIVHSANETFSFLKKWMQEVLIYESTKS